jgi:glycosyltransferase involved in cell wall biosynthesis
LLVSERSALAHARLVIVPSAATAHTLDIDYAVPPGRIVVAPPGTDPMPVAAGSNDGVLNLLSVGSVVPRKDHGLLIEALGGLADLSWRLTIAGSLDRAPEHVVRLHDAISRHGLTGRIRLTGPLSVSELAPYWRSTDLYVSSSRHEGYGMAIAEALSQGIPVVATEAGAVAGWVDRRAAIIVPSGDAEALRRALTDVLSDATLRRRLRDGALTARDGLPVWRASAATVGDRLDGLTLRRH